MSVSASVFYCLCSGSMAFINKAVLTSYSFQHPSILLFGQMIFTSSLLKILKTFNFLTLPDVNRENLYQCAIPSVFYTAHAVLALSALSGMSIPMYTVLKRCVPLANLILAVTVLSKELPGKAIIGAVIVITMGCVITGLGDLTFDVTAYTAGALSVISHASYLTSVQKLQNKMSATGILYLNTFICIPLLFIFILMTFNLSTLYHFPYLKDPFFILLLCTVMCMGCMLNYSIFLCTTLNSALTTSIVGGIKGVITTAIGMVTFGGVQPTILNVSGILVNTAGTSWYIYEKYKEAKAHK